MSDSWNKFINEIQIPDESKADMILAQTLNAEVIKKLAKKRADDRGGWWRDTCEIELLFEMAIQHLKDSCHDPHQLIDAINLLAMVRHKIIEFDMPYDRFEMQKRFLEISGQMGEQP